jgi:hypothetical protein
MWMPIRKSAQLDLRLQTEIECTQIMTSVFGLDEIPLHSIIDTKITPGNTGKMINIRILNCTVSPYPYSSLNI